MDLWRITRSAFAGDEFSGEGARMFGGRWNDRGLRVVYTATSIALAAVEAFVNTDPSQAPDDLILGHAILPKFLPIETIDLSAFPSLDLSLARAFGSEWIRSRRSVALRVPSLAVEHDWNVLLNPNHPHFSVIQQLPSIPWHFDPRMFLPRG